jgi:hypothetical protein
MKIFGLQTILRNVVIPIGCGVTGTPAEGAIISLESLNTPGYAGGLQNLLPAFAYSVLFLFIFATLQMRWLPLQQRLLLRCRCVTSPLSSNRKTPSVHDRWRRLLPLQ